MGTGNSIYNKYQRFPTLIDSIVCPMYQLQLYSQHQCVNATVPSKKAHAVFESRNCTTISVRFHTAIYESASCSISEVVQVAQ